MTFTTTRSEIYRSEQEELGQTITTSNIRNKTASGIKNHVSPFAVATTIRSASKSSTESNIVDVDVISYYLCVSSSSTANQFFSNHPYRINRVEDTPDISARSIAIHKLAQHVPEQNVGFSKSSPTSKSAKFLSISQFKEFYRKLDELANLPENWDSYGAEPPNNLAISLAHKALDVLTEMNFRPSRVTPSVENGIGISFIFEDKYADIECFNTGEVLAVISDGKEIPDVWEVELTRQGLKSAVGKIRVFLQK